MPRFTYTGPSYNPSVGIAIEGTQNLGSWDGITTDDIGGDAIFLRAMLLFYIFPEDMTDTEVLNFITANPQYTAWWADSNPSGGGIGTHGRYDSVDSARIASLVDGDIFTLNNPDSVLHGALIEIIDS